MAILLGLLLFVLAAITATRVLEGVPHSQDEVAYLFQARLFARGELYRPSLPEEVRPFFDHEFVVNNGKWYGKYPPLTSALLAPVDAIGVPWLMNAVLGAAAAFLLYRLTTSVFSARTGLLAAGLFAVSPFSVLMSSGFMSHAVALVLNLVFFIALTRVSLSAAGSSTWRWHFVAGVAVGLEVLARPYNSVLLLTVYGLVWLRMALRDNARFRATALRDIVWFGSPLLLLVAMILVYNRALTGDPLLFGHQVYSPWDQVGFGPRGVEGASEYDLQDLRSNLRLNLKAVDSKLIAWPGTWLLAAAPLAFLGRRREVAALALSFLVAQITAYAAYFHAGVYMGPRYWYEATWVLLVLVAEGISVLTGAVGRWRGAKVGGWSWALVAMLLVVGSIRSDTIKLPGFEGYNAISRPVLPEFETPALVFIPARENWQAYGRYFSLQSPFIEEEAVVFARDGAGSNVHDERPLQSNQLLVRYLPGRYVYRLEPGSSGRLVLLSRP